MCRRAGRKIVVFPRKMRLTQTRHSSRDDDFPYVQLLVLALCRLAEPIAITSIFPYAWRMVIGFEFGSKSDASFYCGIIIAAFSLAESFTSIWWGTLSDRIGRKPVLLLGCCGTILSLLVVGFSESFAVALFGRILGGLLNGNIGVIQTMVSELIKKPEHEPKAYAVMPFVWSVGTIVGPSIGGLLADPAHAYPGTFSKHGFFGRHPWALPNIVCAGLMLLSVIAGYLIIDETHPDLCKGADPTIHHDLPETTPMITGAGANADQGIDLRQESYGTFNEVEVSQKEEWEIHPDGTSVCSQNDKTCMREKWLTPQVAMLTLALGIFSYHSMCYDHLLPIFFQDERSDEISILSTGMFHVPGGLGMSTRDVGIIMSINGLIALFIQAVIFPFAADKLGVFRVFVLVTVLHPIAYFIVPYLALLPESALLPGIYTCLAIRNLLSILDYPVLLILLKQASISPSVLGRINGLAAAAGAACRTVAPPVAGLLYGWGSEMGFTGLAWWGAGAMALVGVVQLYFVPRGRAEGANVKPILPCFAAEEAQEHPRDVVDVTVYDEERRV